MKMPEKSLIPGLLAAVGLAVASVLISKRFPQPGAISLAIFIGIVVGNLLPERNLFSDGFGFAERVILPVAIALMGSELDLHAIGQTGASAFIVLPVMTAAIFLSVPLGRLFGLSKRSALLLGVGNSVCGSSAVLAAAPPLKVEKHETAVAVAVVNLMGTVGLFVLPALTAALHLTENQAAGWIGGSLQAVGQVAASGFSVSDNVGNHALVVKMIRVLMIGPIAMLLHYFFSPSEKEGKRRRLCVPAYILGFIGFAVLASFLPPGHVLLLKTRLTAKFLMVTAMIAIGSRIRFRSLLVHGSKALLLTAVLSLLQAGGILLLLTCFL
ncbi:MAG: putative sulfate exporter family transporter [Pontiellaceae bacterium]|nr:putative sulfate exporter family transporter [Pontiellaceae bacterium]